MGRYSDTFIAFWVLGMSRTWVLLIELGIFPDAKNSLISATMVGLTAVQFAWKKDAENPSGPGALSGWIEKRAFLISASVGTLVSLVFVSWLIRGERAFWTTSSPTVPIDAKISSKYRATSTKFAPPHTPVNLQESPEP